MPSGLRLGICFGWIEFFRLGNADGSVSCGDRSICAIGDICAIESGGGCPCEEVGVCFHGSGEWVCWEFAAGDGAEGGLEFVFAEEVYHLLEGLGYLGYSVFAADEVLAVAFPFCPCYGKGDEDGHVGEVVPCEEQSDGAYEGGGYLRSPVEGEFFESFAEFARPDFFA